MVWKALRFDKNRCVKWIAGVLAETLLWPTTRGISLFLPNTSIAGDLGLVFVMHLGSITGMSAMLPKMGATAMFIVIK